VDTNFKASRFKKASFGVEVYIAFSFRKKLEKTFDIGFYLPTSSPVYTFSKKARF